MAWIKKYQVPFQSLAGTQYMVYIYEQGSTQGSITTLTGASEPFVTQEDNDDDIYKPIRVQTGYLRVVDETNDGSLLETIMPTNNTQKLVRLYSGTWNDAMTIFTDGVIKWQGFMCAQAFTQPWDKQKKVIEFPVKSLLGAMEDISIQESFASTEPSYGSLIEQAFTQLNVTPGYVTIINNLDFPQYLVQVMIQCAMYFKSETVNNNGDSYKQLVSDSFYEVLSSVAKLFGIQLREEGDTLGIVMYDKGGSQLRIINHTSWSNFQSYIHTWGGWGEDVAIINENLLSYLSFRGTDNIAEFTQGAKEAVVDFSFNEKDLNISELPMTTEDTSTVYEIQDIITGQVFVQPHAPRTNSIEVYDFYEYVTTGYHESISSPLYEYVGESTYQNCLNNSVIFSPLFNPRYSADDHLHTGCFPVRWMYKKDAQSQPMMKNGLMMNTMYQESKYVDGTYQMYYPIPNYCYEIKSTLQYSLTDGYIHINMRNYNFMRGRMGGDNDKLYFGEFNIARNGEMPQTKLWCYLRVGNYMWTPDSGWVVYSNSLIAFPIDFNGETIKTNKTTEMSVDENEGWFIPIPSDITLNGNVRFLISNVSFCDVLPPQSQQRAWRDAHCRIISELNVEFLQSIDPMASRRTNNTYRQKIVSSGFSETEEIDLGVGTYNNNIPSYAFIKEDSTTYLESLNYYPSSGSTMVSQRPEMNLLGRIVAQFNQVRRTFRAITQSGLLNLISKRYTYLDRYFFGIDANHNWREDTQEVKFIEVT